jgi:hypothetical protein
MYEKPAEVVLDASNAYAAAAEYAFNFGRVAVGEELIADLTCAAPQQAPTLSACDAGASSYFDPAAYVSGANGPYLRFTADGAIGTSDFAWLWVGQFDNVAAAATGYRYVWSTSSYRSTTGIGQYISSVNTGAATATLQAWIGNTGGDGNYNGTIPLGVPLAVVMYRRGTTHGQLCVRLDTGATVFDTSAAATASDLTSTNFVFGHRGDEPADHRHFAGHSVFSALWLDAYADSAELIALALEWGQLILGVYSGTDTLTPSLAEASSSLVGVDRSDSLGGSLTETLSPLIQSVQGEALTPDLTEVLTLLALLEPSDSLSPGVLEGASLSTGLDPVVSGGSFGGLNFGEAPFGAQTVTAPTLSVEVVDSLTPEVLELLGLLGLLDVGDGVSLNFSSTFVADIAFLLVDSPTPVLGEALIIEDYLEILRIYYSWKIKGETKDIWTESSSEATDVWTSPGEANTTWTDL